jgi:choline dehydrogenase-like flavoprotein
MSDLTRAGIHEWPAYTQDTVLRTQVCIIGSGCGGATLAARLAARGVDVIVVEQGAYVPAAKMDQDELNMTARLYGARGMATDASFSTNLLYGNNVGGASVHYWADSYRTPPDKLAEWRDVFGVKGHGEAELAPAFADIERTLNVHEAADDYFNRMNELFRDAANKLGWHGHRVPQARKGCAKSGHCMQGCLYDAKQSQMITHIPQAVANGARVLADLRAERLQFNNQRVVALDCVAMDRPANRPGQVRLRIEAQAFAVAAGGFNSSFFLLQQALPQPLPALGRHVSMNPSAMVHALFDEDITLWRGMPAAFGCDEFRVARRDGEGNYREGGYLLMPNQVQPGMFAAVMPGTADERARWMRNLKRVRATIIWMDDIADELGEIRVKDGKRQLVYDYGPQTRAVLLDSIHKQCELLFTAGARELVVAGQQGIRLSSRADLHRLADLEITGGGLYLAAPHPGGGCRMGADPRESVTGFDHRVHGTDNLYVADSSVFPTSSSLDPSLTIMAFSYVAADQIRARLA